MVEILDSFSTTPASNNGTPPYGAPEGMNVSDLNDCLRLLMASDAEIGVRLAALETTEAGLGTMSTQNATAVAITGGTITGATITLQADAVTLAMMAAGTAGGLIGYNASGDPAEITPGTDGLPLVANGAAAVPAYEQLATAGIADLAVTEAKLAADAVTLAKMAAGTAGGFPIYDASGNPADIGAGTSGQVPTSQGAGAAIIWATPTQQASASQVRDGTSGVYISPSAVESAGAEVALSEANIVSGIDWDSFQNGTVELTAARVMAIPTNMQLGQWRQIAFTQDITGGWALSFASGFKFPNGSVPPNNTGAGETDVWWFYAKGASEVWAFQQPNVSAP